MESTTIWWLLAGAAVGLELLTGTFYLLMLALGLSAGAAAAHAGSSIGWQYLMATILGGSAVLVWYLKQSRQKAGKDINAESNRHVHLDIGSSVEVAAWSPSGTAQVMHRGAQWAARHSASDLQANSHFEAGVHRISAVQGNTLVLVKV